jgi:SAM-dependent methyltransferase
MSSSTFKDYFSASAADYATFRPTYPAALFDFIAAIPEHRRTVWDCATGNGQAAVPLAGYFGRVIATDGSPEQIAHATPHPRVSYGVALADASGIEDASVDLVTVAQALHWVPLEGFFAEAKRVLAPGGALAVWCYKMAVLEGPLNDVLSQYYSETCRGYWPPERAPVDEGYRSISIPIDELAAPPLVIEAELTLNELGGYLRTWSATRKLAAAIGRDPVIQVENELRSLWGDPRDRHMARWPIHVRAGRLRAEC